MKFQMPIPSSNRVKLDLYFQLNSKKILSFIHSIKNYIYQFEDNIDLNLHLLKQSEGNDTDRANIQVMMNCVDKDDIYDLIGLYKEECIEKENYTKNCFENIAAVLSQSSNQKFLTCC